MISIQYFYYVKLTVLTSSVDMICFSTRISTTDPICIEHDNCKDINQGAQLKYSIIVRLFFKNISYELLSESGILKT